MRLVDEKMTPLRPDPLSFIGLKSPKGSPTSFVSALKLHMEALLTFDFF